MSEHGHDHGAHRHDGEGHAHAITMHTDRRYLTIALALIVGLWPSK